MSSATAPNLLAPIFEAPPAKTAQPRLLLISYHFPPGQSVGALRWQKLSLFAAERGWQLDVVTAHPSGLKATDPARLLELPPGTRVFGVPLVLSLQERLDNWLSDIFGLLKEVRSKRKGITVTPDGATGASKVSRKDRASSVSASDIRWNFKDRRTLIRAYHAVVRRSKWHAWARSAEAVAMSVVHTTVHSAVISCGPPHGAHVAASRVSIARNLPFIMDMRDPWSLIERLPEDIASPLWLGSTKRDERRALARASIVVCNTESARRALAAAYPTSRASIITVMNGYDEEVLPSSRRDSRFTIGYAGSIYIDRDPRMLFRAAAQVIRDLRLSPMDIGLDFIGNVEEYEGIPVSQIANEEGIAPFVTVGPSRLRPAMLDFLAGAAMLVSLPQDSDLAIPSKVFEYMQFDAWLLVLADKGSATELLLRGSGADVVGPRDVDGLATVLRSRYEQHARGIRAEKLSRDGRFSRRGQAKILFDALEEAVAVRPDDAATLDQRRTLSYRSS